MALTQPQPDSRNAEYLLSLLTPAQRELVEARRSHCEPCSQNKKLSIVSVQCDACGCAGVSLIHGRCKLRKWPPAPGRDADGHAIAMPPAPAPEPKTPARLQSPATPHAIHLTPGNTRSSDTPSRELFVYGFPGLYAGANTELHHQIILWRKMGLSVHLIPGGEGYRQQTLYPEMIDLGVVVHDSKAFEAIPPGVPVLSFCNVDFLNRIDDVLRYSHNTVFINCMSWLFEAEKARHRQGKIAAFLYQNEDVRHACGAELREINPAPDVKYLPVRSYIDTRSFPFVDAEERNRQRQNGTFMIGRISRDAGDKYSANTLSIWEQVQTSGPKRGIMLGFGQAAQKKIGTPPEWVQTYINHKHLSQKDFYRQVDVLVQPMDTTETGPRVGLEAMASGTVVIADNRGGWRNMVEHGVTGWLCDSPEDFIRYATQMAHEPEQRAEMAKAARTHLDEVAGFEVCAASWEAALKQLGVEVPERLEKTGTSELTTGTKR